MITLSARFAGAQENAKPVPAETIKTEPLEGLWPSPKLMNSLLIRWADNVSDQYELDDEQRTEVRDAVVQRWGRFLNENRAEVQPLFNEFLEMRMGVEPPEKEAVQAWAKRAQPVFQQFREQISAGTDEFREVLNPLQRGKFELEALQFGVGVQMAQRKLKQWEGGEFEPEEFWVPPRAERRERRDARRKGTPAPAREVTEVKAETEEADQIVVELGRWDKYVEEFIRIYDLDEGQRSAARSCLSELKQRALDHRDRQREEIAALEHRIRNNTGTDRELAEIKAELVTLYGPIDDSFSELKRRIELIPTTEQRVRVAERGGKHAPESSDH